MASRAGPRTAGTDGSDFRHRERVAEHFQMRWGNSGGPLSRKAKALRMMLHCAIALPYSQNFTGVRALT
uniref:Uncharacterized protein n=1 Tax=Varanus komodoensis TaxID=61221 RepID=A0A8D2LJ76_VARKO